MCCSPGDSDCLAEEIERAIGDTPTQRPKSSWRAHEIRRARGGLSADLDFEDVWYTDNSFARFEDILLPAGEIQEVVCLPFEDIQDDQCVDVDLDLDIFHEQQGNDTVIHVDVDEQREHLLHSVVDVDEQREHLLQRVVDVDEHRALIRSRAATRQGEEFDMVCCTGAFHLDNDLYDSVRKQISRDFPLLELELKEWPAKTLEDGSTYIGQWLGNSRHGEGLLTHPDGTSYRGTFVSGKANGHGEHSSADAIKYIGHWMDGLAHGRGKYTHKDGSIYEGEWAQDEKCGRGVETWPDGGCYDGEFRHGVKHGQGTHISANGASYMGQFVLDQMEGEGTYFYADGRIYNGQWLQGRSHGIGKMTMKDGSTHEGIFGISTEAYEKGWKLEGQI